MIAGKMTEKLLKIGDHLVGKNSKKILVSLFQERSGILIDLFRSSTLPADRIYEIRYDLFAGRSEKDLETLLPELDKLGISFIFTYRGERKETLLYSGIAAQYNVAAIDIDYSLMYEFDPLESSLIASSHVYDGTISFDVVEKMIDSPADMVKAAAFYRNNSEFLHDAALLAGLREKSDKPFTFVPMGPESAAMRMASFILISDSAYARYDNETAEGQLSYEEYLSVLNAVQRNGA